MLVAVTSVTSAQTAAVDFFAQATLLGMQLSAQHGARKGAISSAQATCVQALKPIAFYGTVGQVLASALDSKDLPAVDRFFTTPVGRKYAKYGLLQIYPAVGERAPEPLPTFSDSEYRELEVFAATPAGRRLISDKVMQSVEAKSAYDSRIRELLEQCREK